MQQCNVEQQNKAPIWKQGYKLVDAGVSRSAGWGGSSRCWLGGGCVGGVFGGLPGMVSLVLTWCALGGHKKPGLACGLAIGLFR